MIATDTGERERDVQNTGIKPVADSHRFDVNLLAESMKANVIGFSGPLKIEQFKGGQSNPTFRLNLPSGSYVMRRKPLGKSLPSAHAVDREYQGVSALNSTVFPVPRPFALCEDEAIIGGIFYVMEMIEGRILWDQSLPACAPRERHAIHKAALKTLADLHNTDYRAAGLASFGRPSSVATQDLVNMFERMGVSTGPDLATLPCGREPKRIARQGSPISRGPRGRVPKGPLKSVSSEIMLRSVRPPLNQPGFGP